MKVWIDYNQEGFSSRAGGLLRDFSGGFRGGNIFRNAEVYEFIVSLYIDQELLYLRRWLQTSL